jgi:hypothetical protein
VDRPTTSPAVRRDYERIAERVAQEPGVTAGKLFGMPALLLERKAFAGLYGDAMVFKLSGAEHAAALSLTGTELFDPSGMGRAMKAWVVVPTAHAGEWDGLADQALASSRLAR